MRISEKEKIKSGGWMDGWMDGSMTKILVVEDGGGKMPEHNEARARKKYSFQLFDDDDVIVVCRKSSMLNLAVNF